VCSSDLFGFYGGAKSWLSHSLYDDSNRTLGLYTAGLKELLGKFRPLPQIYALHPQIQAMLQNPDNLALRQQVIARFCRMGSGLAKTGDRAIDQFGKFIL